MQQCIKKQNKFAKNILYIIIVAIITFPINPSFSNEVDILADNDKSAIENANKAELDVVPGEVIIKFKSGSLKKEPRLNNGKIDTSIASIDILFDQFKASDIKKLIPKQIPQFDGIYRIKFSPLFSLTDILTLLKRDPSVEWAEPNYILSTCDLPNDYNPATQWGLAKINANQAWDYTHGSTSVTIAIVDIGVDYNHPDLSDNIWINTDEIPDDGIDNDGNGFIDDNIGWDFVSATSGGAIGEDMAPPDNDPMDFGGHGTHCSGIASAVTNNGIGVAGTGWNCKIMAVRAGYATPGGGGSLNEADATSAIVYAADNGANIISMSWGASDPLPAILLALNYARTKGCVLVAAAGNNGSTALFYPAAYPGVIAVAASDQNDAKASFSNYGSWIEIAAPGKSIYNTVFNDTYTSMSGTSMAAPCVAGVAGLILSINPLLNADDVATKIISNADPTTWTIKRINAYRAVFDSIPLTVSVSANPQAGQVVTVTADVDISANAASLILYYKQGGKIDYQELSFTLQSGTLKAGTWTATIPAAQVNTRGIVYYVELTDVDGKKCSYGNTSAPYFIAVHGDITISLKTTPPSSANAWNFIAPSVITDDKTVAGNFSSFGTFGSTWIAWRWNTTDSRWEVSQDFGGNFISPDQFDVTSSWWIALDGDGSSTEATVTGTSVDSSKPYSITLKTGWNSIANPFDYPVAWSGTNIKVEYSGGEVTLAQAVANNWVDNRAIWYDNTARLYITGYSDEAPPYAMLSKRGQWLYSVVDGAKLIIPPVEYISSLAPPSIPYQEKADSWKIVLSLKTKIGEDKVEAIVLEKEIKNNEHNLDYIKPPSSPLSVVRIDLARPDYNSDQIIWEFVVKTPIGGYLQWNFVNVPDDYSLVIKEDGSDKTIDLRQNMDFSITGSESSRKFVLKASKQRIPVKTQAFANYPNPFNPETWIPYELSSESEVMVKIYTFSGQLVRTLDLGRKPAGFYTNRDKAIYWNGKNEYGEIVSSGVYFYSIKAGDKIFNHKMIVLR
jgi:thermitase